MRLTRRRLLGATGTGTAAVLAGCLADDDPGVEGDDGDDDHDGNETDDDYDGNETDDDYDGNETDDYDGNETDDDYEEEADGNETDDEHDNETADQYGGGIVEYELVDYDSSHMETAAEHFTNQADAESHLEGHEDALSLVDETDFETDSLLALETRGENGCYELEITSMEADDDLQVTAAAVDTSDDDEVCTQEIVSLGLLVWVTYDGDGPAGATVTITDGQGEQHEFGWENV